MNIGTHMCEIIFNFQVYWKPKLTIKRSTGSFRVRVSDLVKYNRDSDLQVMSE